MTALAVLLLALAAAAPAAAQAAVDRPEAAYTRESGRVERGLAVGAGRRGVVRFGAVRRRPFVELQLDLSRQPRRGTVIAFLRDGTEVGRTNVPGRGRRLFFDLTRHVRSGRSLTVYLRGTSSVRFHARGARRPRLVGRSTLAPPRRPPRRFARVPGASVVGAAGDVACSPRTTGFNAGRGTWTDCREATVARMLAAGGLDAVLALGDLQYPRGALADFRSGYERSWGRLRAITRPVVGNHEYETPGASGYWDYFGAAAGRRGEGYYSFDLHGWHVVALNTNCEFVSCAAGSEQERWLREDLAAHPAACTLALMHHPRFTSGPNENGLAGYPVVAPLWDALQDARADVVLGAHMHNYERFPALNSAGAPDARAPVSFVVGTGGRNLAHRFARHPASAAFTARDFGYLRLVLREGGFDWEFVAEDETGFEDAGTGECRA